MLRAVTRSLSGPASVEAILDKKPLVALEASMAPKSLAAAKQLLEIFPENERGGAITADFCVNGEKEKIEDVQRLVNFGSLTSVEK